MTLLLPNTSQAILKSEEEFNRVMGIKYVTQLEFINSKAQNTVIKKCRKALDKGLFDPRQKWLGSYYSQEILGCRDPDLDLTIAWIDPVFGYGVFTNQPIRAHTYVGEYMGVVRKNRFFGRSKNFYCFDYTIGFGLDTPFVIDAQSAGNYTRYINHSDKPNLETASVFCNGIMHMIMYALCDIPKGTQLCYDYGFHYWERRKNPLPLEARATTLLD